MSIRLCGTCNCFDKLEVPANPADPEAQPRTVAVCRAKPPVPTLVQGPQGPQAITIWPQVDPNKDWCAGWYAPR